MLPTHVGIGFSRDETSALSNSIRLMTRPGLSPCGPWAEWSHEFLIFRFRDGSAVIHEALMSEGWCAKPAKKLGCWLSKNPKRHVAELHWLPIDETAVQLIYMDSCAWIGTKSYARRQLLAFAIAESAVGRWLGLTLTSGPNEVICSEGADQIVGERCPAWDLRNGPTQSWDSMSPQRSCDNLRVKEKALAIKEGAVVEPKQPGAFRL